MVKKSLVERENKLWFCFFKFFWLTFFFGEEGVLVKTRKKCLVTIVTTFPTITTLTAVTTGKVRKVGFSYHLIPLRSLFAKMSDRETNWQTIRLLELPWASKNYLKFNFCNKSHSCSNYINTFCLVLYKKFPKAQFRKMQFLHIVQYIGVFCPFIFTLNFCSIRYVFQ